jgi:hypothetical protein
MYGYDDETKVYLSILKIPGENDSRKLIISIELLFCF